MKNLYTFLLGLLLLTLTPNIATSQIIIDEYSYASAYDSDAQAFFDVNTGLSGTQKTAINDLVLDFKANGTWSGYRAIYPMIGGTASAHKWNLKDPRDLDAAFRITFYGTWTHNSLGAKGDGTSAYGDTHFVDGDNWTDAGTYINCTIGYYSNLDIAGDSGSNTEIGADTSDNSKEFILQINDGGGMYGRVYNTSSISGRGTSTNTKWAVANALNGNSYLFENGSPQGAVTTQGTNSFLPETIYLNSSRSATSSAIMSVRRCAFAIIGNGFTNTEISNDYTVIQAYQTALSREN